MKLSPRMAVVCLGGALGCAPESFDPDGEGDDAVTHAALNARACRAQGGACVGASCSVCRAGSRCLKCVAGRCSAWPCGQLPVSPPAPPTVARNLAWSGAPTYAPASTRYDVEGFGVDGPVDELPAGTRAVTVTRTVAHTGNAWLPPYSLRARLAQWMFIGDRWVERRTAAEWDVPGPALGPGGSAPASFTFNVPSSCGLYRLTLTADGGGAVVESDEADNVAHHFLFVRGAMALNLAVAPRGDVTVTHAAAALGTHTFTATPSTPGTTFTVHGRAPRPGPLGSVAALFGVPAGPVGARTAVTLNVTGHGPNVHPPDERVETLLAKVTAITTDGCYLRQQVAAVHVTH